MEKFEFLTDETYMALKLTTLSTIRCVRYLLKNGFHFVLTRRFNSDPVEQVISGVRAGSAASGSADATTAVAVLYSLERTVKLGLLSASTDANVKVGKAIAEIFPSGKLDISDILSDEVFQNVGVEKLYNITYPEEFDNISFGTAGVTKVAGFCIKIVKKLNICSQMTRAIEDNDKESTWNRLIHPQDRGGLHYPTALFSGFAKSILDCMDQFNDSNSTRSNVFSFWVQTILPNIPDFLSCGCGDIAQTNELRKRL